MNCATTNAFLLMIDDHCVYLMKMSVENNPESRNPVNPGSEIFRCKRRNELRDYERVFANDRRSLECILDENV